MRATRIVRRLLVACLAVGLAYAGGSLLFQAGLTSARVATSACACGTVNQDVVYSLNALDDRVRQYAVEHGGLFPSYAELAAMVTDDWDRRHLTAEVDFASGTFTFVPGLRDIHKIGYAVSADRRDYVLLGIGWTVYSEVTDWYGHRVSSRVLKHELPILHPGSTPPEPSPYS